MSGREVGGTGSNKDHVEFNSALTELSRRITGHNILVKLLKGIIHRKVSISKKTLGTLIIPSTGQAKFPFARSV